MGKAPVARGAPKNKRRRGSYRLPVTVFVCFLGLFLFFVVLSVHGSSSSGHNGRRNTRGATRGAGAELAAVRRPDGLPRLFRFNVVDELPHDSQAFTQGLQFDRICETGGQKHKCREVFWESTGLNGRSTVREVEVASGNVLRSKKLDQADFGEGLTRLADRLYQVVWMSGKTWSYAVDDFEDAQQLQTPLADGWGITTDGSYLVVGDSTDKLTWVDPAADMKSVRQVAVHDAGTAIPSLNELECVEGLVWANIWHSDCIAQIDPASGDVLGWVLLGGLRMRAEEAAAADAAASNTPFTRLDHEAVLNGIAYDAEQRRLFVTGKLWPRVYQVELEEVAEADHAAAVQGARQQCLKRRIGLR